MVRINEFVMFVAVHT